ncbi:MAG TPA: lipid-A-disaccharide synthase [Candidatus Binataceae bacterium]|nr:lipid-A-disaccharide synthase [Candidatus Binataceae bacterium]
MSAPPKEKLPTAAASAHRRRRVMIVAGEASGDLHGADLAAQILARDPACELFGVAGERMRAAGVRALTRTEDIAGLGLAELASTIWSTLGALRELKAIVRRERPDLVILIDFAEFNMSLARAAKRAGVPVLYYITPQVWAWRRGRVARIIERTDRLAVVLPFEAELYASAGGRVTFVGHPLLGRVAPAQDRAATLKRHGLPAHARLLALLPGSRRGEVRYLLRPMVEAARVLEADHGLTPVIALAPTLTLAQLREEGRVNFDGIRVIEGDTYSIVAASELALAASGTATLEVALLGCPMVVAYKVSPLTYALARMLVHGVDYFAMPNILAGREVVPELLQSRVNARNLVRAAENLMVEPLHTETRDALLALRARLGEPGAAARVAAIALEMMA